MINGPNITWLPHYAVGLTLPLLTSSSGEKLSKSTGNAVWLSPDKTSPFEFYQTFVQIPDQDVSSWLKYFTFLSLEEINNVLRHHQVCLSLLKVHYHGFHKAAILCWLSWKKCSFFWYALMYCTNCLLSRQERLQCTFKNFLLDVHCLLH